MSVPTASVGIASGDDAWEKCSALLTVLRSLGRMVSAKKSPSFCAEMSIFQIPALRIPPEHTALEEQISSSRFRVGSSLSSVEISMHPLALYTVLKISTLHCWDLHHLNQRSPHSMLKILSYGSDISAIQRWDLHNLALRSPPCSTKNAALQRLPIHLKPARALKLSTLNLQLLRSSGILIPLSPLQSWDPLLLALKSLA